MFFLIEWKRMQFMTATQNRSTPGLGFPSRRQHERRREQGTAKAKTPKKKKKPIKTKKQKNRNVG